MPSGPHCAEGDQALVNAISTAILFVLAVLSSASLGQTAAPAQRTQVPSSAPQERLGRLFLTPLQRQELDRRRQLNIKEAVIANEGSLTVNGQVSRSSGRTTTWINGTPEHDSHRPADPAVVSIQAGGGEARVRLKVGQSLDKARAEITDGLAGGEVHRNPRPAQRP
jgi:hypothetical protein